MKRRSQGVPSAYVVKPVLKALRVLKCLGDAGRELSLVEVCRLVGLPKPTVYKYLQTLREAGFVLYDSELECYWLGPNAWSLGRTVNPSLRVREVARPIMQHLCDRFGETINLGVLHGDEVVYLEMAVSRQALRLQATIGGHDPAYSTSLGRAMIAFLPRERWAKHIPRRLQPRTPHTITSHESLYAELIATRKRGYAIEREENEPGALCIGAPIFDQDGEVVAALSLSAPATRIGPAHEGEVAEAVMRAARDISARLGYRSATYNP
ncbi:MAG: IclR family transcriptional regulator [Thermoflexales bacterium]|nr:IclR family transcriptional regulator [Thermoflexales bacterium]